MDELDEAVPHSNSNWPDISQMARQIKNLKPLYEVKLLILLTGANFWIKIPMFTCVNKNFQPFHYINSTSSATATISCAYAHARARARARARSSTQYTQQKQLHRRKNAWCAHDAQAVLKPCIMQTLRHKNFWKSFWKASVFQLLHGSSNFLVAYLVPDL